MLAALRVHCLRLPEKLDRGSYVRLVRMSSRLGLECRTDCYFEALFDVYETLSRHWLEMAEAMGLVELLALASIMQ